MTDKLKMHTANKADENFKRLAEMFPNAVTETKDENGEVVRAIDKDVLMQEINTKIVEGNEERYQFTWPDKKKSVLLANAPINKTLRPCREESVDFDNTENLYIEGDNLEVLKLLQETYLGKIKMIYIDPPYNTGNDFVYEDDFAQSTEEYLENSGQFDEDGNRLVKNLDSNGRFHTDWLNMIYPRLKIAKDLLADDGVIFISIDDNEQVNLAKICNEIFGAENCIGPIIQNKQNAKNDTLNIQKNHEFILAYRKTILVSNGSVEPTLFRKIVTYKDAYEENGRYFYLNDSITTRGEGGTLNARPNLGYTVYYNPISKDKFAVADYDLELAKTANDEKEVYNTDNELIKRGYIAIRPPRVRGKLGCWTWALEKFNKQKDEIIITGKQGAYAVRKRTFVDANDVNIVDGKMQYAASTTANSRSILDFSTNEGTNALNSVLGNSAVFNNPKNLELMKYLVQLVNDKTAIILDFFSGSATTAHAVMQLNAEDGGHRKFIMVQLPEKTDEKSEAYKAGYKNICEIGKKRIRRAGQKIKDELKYKVISQNGKVAIRRSKSDDTIHEESSNPDIIENPTIVKIEDTWRIPRDKENYDALVEKLDTGFRVLKCDSTNMKDVYYNPAEIDISMFDNLVDNIKDDRTPEDLLFQVMIDLGILLSSKIQVRNVELGVRNYIYFDVADGFLIACFDKEITTDVITEIAKKQPYYFVMRDNGFADDSVATNFEQIFATYSPETVRKVL